MTREEAIEDLKYLIQYDDYGSLHRESINSAIKALEQESVLDKIRAEIEQKARPNEIGGRGNGKSIRHGLCMALEIKVRLGHYCKYLQI